jgi:hypothetical protein
VEAVVVMKEDNVSEKKDVRLRAKPQKPTVILERKNYLH